jgi:hypothetical protein
LKLTEQQHGQFDEDGYLVLNDVLCGDRLAKLTDECMRAWLAEKGEFDPEVSWLQNSLLPDIHNRSRLVCGYYFQGPLVDVAEQLVGPNIKGVTSQLTFKLSGNNKPFGWHQDNGYGHLDPATAISTLTALDDADIENGCLWVLPGSHQSGQIDVSERLTTEAKEAGVDLSVKVDCDSDAIPVPLKAGDAVVLHCHLLHRSEGNLSPDRDRRILFLRYADADAVEVYNDRRPRLGPLLRGATCFPEVAGFERYFFVDNETG